MTATTAAARPQDLDPTLAFLSRYLAWDSLDNENKRNRWGLILILFFTFAIIFVAKNIEVPKVDRAVAEKVPERLAKLVQEKKEEPPPPPPPKEEVKEEEKPEETRPEEKPVEKPKPTEVQVQKAREQASKAFAEAQQEISAMQDLASAFEGMDNQPLAKGDGAGTGGGVNRDIIGSRAGKGSGGVSTGTASSGGGGYGVAGGGKIAGGPVTKVESSLGGGGAAGGPTRKTASGKLERTQEEVRRIVERNNGALQAIYQRALRANPTLKGTIVIRVVIAADGSVTSCDLVSSELNDPETEKKLLTRFKAINFGAIEGVAVWDDKYTLNFFPS